MDYFLETIRIKKSNLGEGKHVIFLYNQRKAEIMNRTNTEGMWRLECFEILSNENPDEQNDLNYPDEESK